MSLLEALPLHSRTKIKEVKHFSQLKKSPGGVLSRDLRPWTNEIFSLLFLNSLLFLKTVS